MGKNTNENDDSRLLRDLSAQVCALSCGVGALERKNEQLKKKTQQTDFYNLLLEINSTSYDDLKEDLGLEETIKVKYYAKVALARKINDKTEEDKSKQELFVLVRCCMSDGFELAKKIVSQIDNKDWINIAEMIKQIIITTKQNRQLKQKVQQDSKVLSTADLALITSLVGIEYDTMGYRTLERCLGQKGIQKVQHFARVALARIQKNEEAEKYACRIVNIVANNTFEYDVAEELVAKWNKELENKTVFEIVEMINQIMNGATLQNEKQGPQR